MQPAADAVVPFEISDLTEDEIRAAIDVKAQIDRHLLANDPSRWVYRGRSNVISAFTEYFSRKNGAHQLCDVLLEKFEGSRYLAIQPPDESDLSAGVNPGFTAWVETETWDTEFVPAVELPVSVEGRV